MSDLEALQSALADALRKKRRLVDTRDQQANQAKQSVFDQHREGILAATKVVSAAEKALREYKSQNATHEWEGRRVQKQKHVGSWYSRDPMETIYGVVEVRRIGTVLPENVTWATPEIGGAFVRLENKGGKLGKRIDRLGGWTLVEGEQS